MTKLLTVREQALITFLLALLVLGGIVKMVRRIPHDQLTEIKK